MIKYVLILHLCTYFAEPVCTSEKIMPYEYSSYHDCITQGYIHSYKDLMNMDKNIEELVPLMMYDNDGIKRLFFHYPKTDALYILKNI